jgi:hypothetical protein
MIALGLVRGRCIARSKVEQLVAADVVTGAKRDSTEPRGTRKQRSADLDRHVRLDDAVLEARARQYREAIAACGLHQPQGLATPVLARSNRHAVLADSIYIGKAEHLGGWQLPRLQSDAGCEREQRDRQLEQAGET